MLTPREIELEVNDINTLKGIAGNAVRTLNCISNTLIDKDKKNISEQKAFEKIVELLQNFDLYIDGYEGGY